MRVTCLFICLLVSINFLACSSNGNDEDNDELSDMDSETDTNNPDGSDDSLEILPGVGLGELRLGMTYKEIEELIGEYTTKLGFAHIVYLEYRELSLKVIVTSPLDLEVTDDSIVIAFGALEGGNFTGVPSPGTTRAEVEGAFGQPSEETGDFAFYSDGFSCQYSDDTAIAVGVFSAHELRPDPPEMKQATE